MAGVRATPRSMTGNAIRTRVPTQDRCRESFAERKFPVEERGPAPLAPHHAKAGRSTKQQ
jgi:hypothetical protein